MIKLDPTSLLEPTKVYKEVLKDAFHENATSFIDELTKKSGVDLSKNKIAVDEYKKHEAKFNELKKSSGNKKGLRVLFIFLIVLLFVSAIVLILLAIKKNLPLALGIPLGILSIIGGVALIIYIVKSLNKRIKSLDKKLEEVSKKMEEKKTEAYNTLIPLFNLFDWNMAIDVMNQTTPLFCFDQVFDPQKYEYLHDRYGYEENDDDNISTLYVQSGSILGNPFLFERTLCQHMVQKVYTGTLPITWTETVRTENGTKTVTRTQILTATYTAPAPEYYKDTWLIYGNGAAPNLSFSRHPTVTDMSEREVEHHVKSFDKKLDKLVEKSVKSGGSFTRLHNEKFEACFNALDRDNETEFRLLFTPLAQNNMVNLLLEHEVGYGDDFTFIKKCCLNFIHSNHAQGDNIIDAPPSLFYIFDYEECKKKFIDYVDNYARVVFFALAPLTSIPLYQNYKAPEYIYKNNYPGNVTKAEVESSANEYDIHLFEHPKTVTNVILKSTLKSKTKDIDHVNIRAHSFDGLPRVILIPKLGGDGHMHNVPVNWTEYIKVSADTLMSIRDSKFSYQEYLTNKNKIDEFASGKVVNYRKRFVSFINK